MVKISKWLTFEEATKSPNALRLGIDNLPDSIQLANMKHVATNIFDTVRDFIGGPLFASSFFRSKELNDNTPGSSATSQHMTGEAIDIDADMYGVGNNLLIFMFIKDKLTFDQLILEYPNEIGKPSWVHVSLKQNPQKNRGEVLVKLKKRYIPYDQYKVGMI